MGSTQNLYLGMQFTPVVYYLRSVTMRQAYGREDVIPRASIAKMQSQGNSLMPEGLEAGLRPQDLADLLEYIETAENK